MAKENTAAVAVELNELEKVMENMGTPTLKAIAMVLGLQPVRLYYVAKQPKEGCVYDPKVYNWDAIMRFIEKRLNADEGLATFADVIEAALKKDEELKLVDGRRTSTGGSNKTIVVDGKTIAARKFANFEASANMPVCFKKEEAVYAIVLQTASHTVLRSISSFEPLVFNSEEVKIASNGMMNFKAIGPSQIEKCAAERLEKIQAAAEATTEATGEDTAAE